MTRNAKIAVITGSSLALIVLGIFLYLKKRKKKPGAIATSPVTPQNHPWPQVRPDAPNYRSVVGRFVHHNPYVLNSRVITN